MFTPKGAETKERSAFEDGDLDEDMVGKSAGWRYLIAWLPWLQAASCWFREEKNERAGALERKATSVDVESDSDGRKSQTRRREV